jgi:perosamine synthetase
MMIQVFKPSLGAEELEALAEVFKSGWIGLGPKTAEFEERFAAYVGAKYAVALNSATAGLHLACAALGIGAGDEVLVPTISFVSTAHAAEYCGARAVFVDVEEQTCNLDVADAARKVTAKTKAIVPMHYGGGACDMDAVWAMAKRHGLRVIEDAAHACGSEYRGRKVGSLEGTDVTSFSFQAVKNLPVGDGGMLTTSDAEMARRLRQLRWCGIDKSTWERTEEIAQEQESGTRSYAKYGWYYEVQELGYKYHMNDIAAAIGLCQLRKLDAANARRREIAGMYNRLLGDVVWLKCPVDRDDAHQSACHNYVIRTAHRDALNLYLKERNIATGVHYLPLHLQPYYRRRERVSLPVAERVWKELLTLPLYPDLTDEQVEYIAAEIRGFSA